eukprot:TRINITY_DN19898_c0_g1_i1.p1 TRINITY_DN19898_c0_g1~~TRINITY_DN19898_c0_g1_i1.p1  ORF type:complete len:170 (-),score=21.03 TRINITY_DN19898_c0_g1_i1:165-632(-)
MASARPLLDFEAQDNGKKRLLPHAMLHQSTLLFEDTGAVQIVENTGSTARDQLANERTFLAWLRTAVSMVGFGIALVKMAFGDQGAAGVLFGVIFMLVGTGMLLFSTLRYYSAMHLLQRGLFPLDTGGIFVMVIILGTVSIAALLYGAQSLWEKL